MKWFPVSGIAAAALAPLILSAQVEVLPESENLRYESLLPELTGQLAGPPQAHLKTAAGWKNRKAKINAVRSCLDAKAAACTAPVLFYTVPAMSDAQYLPDAYPYNGRPQAPLRILTAKDEFEPASFVVYPFADLGKVEVKLTPLRTESGKEFPADKLDLKVVKVWYQDLNAWYSYFGDQGLKLTPELLLNDEDLIRVDTEEKANYARIQGKDGKAFYRNITLPMQLDAGEWTNPARGASNRTFRAMAESFRDAESLRPVTLNEGEYKQFFLTSHAEKDAEPGLYKGKLELRKNNAVIASLPVELRVLPFVLPKPKTYFDPDRDFYVSSYCYFHYPAFMALNGGDRELAEKQLRFTLKNLAEHNQDIYWMRGEPCSRTIEEEYRALKDAGMRTDLIQAFNVPGRTPCEWEYKSRMLKEYCMKLFGHGNVYLGYGDEPGPGWLMETRPLFRIWQQAGFKFLMAGWNAVFHKAGYLYDWANLGGMPEKQLDLLRGWNQIGHAKVAWYAGHHEGVENPSFNRRQNGIVPYLCGYSALCNYAHHLGPWNDRSHTYRNMVITYGSYDRIIDTLAWEGFREGIDDIRYATLLKTLIREAEKSPDIDTVYTARAALYYLAHTDCVTADQDAYRLELVRYILRLRSLLGKD